MRIARLSTMGIGLPSLCKKISMIYYAQIEILRVVCILFFFRKATQSLTESEFGLQMGA